MNTNFISAFKTSLQRYILPSLQGRGRGVGLLLLCLSFGACSNDDEQGSDIKYVEYTMVQQIEAPTWQIDWNYNQARPDWSKPKGTNYENWTTLMVQIEDALKPFVSKDDLMALFVNNEMRGLANPAIVLGDDQASSAKFLMKIYGNESGSETVNVTLKYYCQNLKHVFSLSDNITLNYDESTGIGEAYIPEFTYGSTKYPVVKTVNAEVQLARAGIKPASDGVVGAFVDDECRGLATSSASSISPLVIYCRNDGESVTLKYYDAIKGQLYTIPDIIK